MEPTIKRLTRADVSCLDRAAADVFDAAIQPDRLEAFLAEPRHLLVVAIVDGAVVGQARAIVHLSPDGPDELYIDNMGVTPALRRRGIGGRMLDEILRWGRERGCDYAWLGTEIENEPARALYESRGGQGAAMVMFAYDIAPSRPSGGPAT